LLTGLRYFIEKLVIDTTSERIIGTNEVLRKVPFGRVTLWREVKAGRFPAPARITPGKNGWRESVVDKHLAAMFNDA
jgi:prophage regulatory protein